MLRGDRRRAASLLVVAIAAMAVPSLAQDRQRPSEVEAALRRRVEAWLHARGQAGLACKACDCVRERAAACRTCDGTGVSRGRVGGVLWRYLPPSFRRDLDEDEWTRDFLGAEHGQLSEGNPFAFAGLVVTDVQLSRDVAWVYYAPDGDRERDKASQWCREGRSFYLCPLLGVSHDPLVEHSWFSGTRSVTNLCLEIERLVAATLEPGLADDERALREEEKSARERQLRDVLVADFGRVLSVERIEDEGNARRALLRVFVDRAVVSVSLRPRPDDTLAAFEGRLGALREGSGVFVRGRTAAWSVDDGWVRELDLTDGEVEVAR